LQIAAYQAPLSQPGSVDVLERIRRRVQQCEAAGIRILCCPEAILGGLADYADEPARLAIPTANIGSVLASLASDTVTTIVGLSEMGSDGMLYSSAAVLHKGAYDSSFPELASRMAGNRRTRWVGRGRSRSVQRGFSGRGDPAVSCALWARRLPQEIARLIEPFSERRSLRCMYTFAALTWPPCGRKAPSMWNMARDGWWAR
jgi:hypothetical protein